MFKRCLTLTGALFASVLFATTASAAPLSDYEEYVTDDFYAVLHYQGTVGNPVRSFGEKLFEALEEKDFINPDARKVMDIAKQHFLTNDLLVVAVNLNTSYIAIPMEVEDMEALVTLIETEEALGVSEVDGQTVYTSFKGDRFAFTYWNEAVLMTDSMRSLEAILKDLNNNRTGELAGHFNEMPDDGFLSMLVSGNTEALKEFYEEMGAGELYAGTADLSEYAWFALRDTGNDHYVVEGYTGWNKVRLDAADFNFDTFTFVPELYQKLPGKDALVYFEMNNLYDYVMGMIELMGLDTLLEAAEETDDDAKVGEDDTVPKSGDARVAGDIATTLESYDPYLQLLNQRLGVVVQWSEGDELPRITLLTEVPADSLDTIRELNALLLPLVDGTQCFWFCPEVVVENDREGAFYTVTESMTQELIDTRIEEMSESFEDEEEGMVVFDDASFYEPYERHYAFGEHNGYYVIGIGDGIVEQLDNPTQTLAENNAFMDYFNRYANGESDLTYLGFYDLAELLRVAASAFPAEAGDLEEALEFLDGVGPWYFQGRAGTDWTRNLMELILPIGKAVDALVPMLITEWEEEATESCTCEVQAMFNDLAEEETDWYERELLELSEVGIVDDSQKEFRPNDPISRAEFATLVVRHYGWEGLKPERRGSQIFDDVAASAWYDTQIGLAYEYGILKGDDTGNTVRPTDPISRAEAAQVLMNVSGLLQSAPDERASFEDVADEVWYSEAVDRTYDRGIVRGVTDTRFEPGRPLTRAEAIVLINRIRERELNFGWGL